MTSTSTETSTGTITTPQIGDPELTGEHERMAHIVAPKASDDGKGVISAAALVTEARIYGTPVTALCGKVWIPDRDPKNYPVCGTCKEIFQAAGRNPDSVGS
jgi:Protein of unknown function (DUF3039)